MPNMTGCFESRLVCCGQLVELEVRLVFLEAVSAPIIPYGGELTNLLVDVYLKARMPICR